MAKQYIPGVSGLLTEPNPADSPSNTLSEAENIVVEQGGKVQARHGFNVKEIETESVFYDDINAISDNSLAGNYSYMSGAAASPSINYSAINYATLVEVFPGNPSYLTTINATATNITVADSTTVPYPNTFSTYYSKQIIETTTSLNRYYTITAPGSKSQVSSDGNIPTTASVYIKRNGGSCIVTLTFGIGNLNIYIPVGFNLDTLTYQFDPAWLASNYNAVKYYNANIQALGNDWYKLSVTCQLRTDLSDGVLPYNPYYLTVYPRMSNEDDVGSQNQFQLAYNGDPYVNGLTAQTYVAGANSTRLNVSAISTAPYMRVGDYIQFLPSQVITGLTADKNYRISEVNRVSNYIVIDHPNQTTTGSLTNRVFTSKADYTLAYLQIYQNPSLSYGEYIRNDSTVYTITDYRTTKIIPGNPTRILYNIYDVGSNLCPYANIVLMKESSPGSGTYIPETNIPTGMTIGSSYRILKTGKVLQTSGIYAGSELFFTDLDIATTGSEIITTSYIKRTGVPVYVADKTAVLANYTFASQYTFTLPTVKLLEYKNSADTVKTILFVKQTVNAYAPTPYGIYATNNTATKTRYYLIDDQGNQGKYETLRYNDVKNAFSTKQSVYLQTENGIAEANVDDIDQDLYTKFFDVKWPSFPDISFKLKSSTTVGNWLKAGYKCKLCITFYRETGYTDKQGVVYESQPSTPIIIESPNFDSIPELYIDFRPEFESTLSYKVLNQFTQANRGRKFGIKVYRTTIRTIDSDFGDELFQCYQDIPFEKFMASTVYRLDYASDDNPNFYEYGLRDSLSSFLPTTSSTISYSATLTNQEYMPIELNVGDYVNVAYDASQTSGSYRVFSADRSLEGSSFNESKYKAVYPAKYSTTDSDLLKFDYRPVRLKVVSKSYKSLANSIGIKAYVYKFQTLDYVHNEQNYDASVGGLGWQTGLEVINPNTIINPMSITTQLWTNPGIYGLGNDRKFLIARSFIVELTINDNGIIEQPQLYTNPNKEGSTNANLVIPRSEKSSSYHGIQVYQGVQSSLIANIFLTRQPKYEQVSLNIKGFDIGPLSNGYNTCTATNFLYNNSTVIKFTGNTTVDSASLSSTSINPITAGITVGMPISGPNIPYGTTVASVSTSSITLSVNAGATATGNTFFIQPKVSFTPPSKTLSFSAVTTVSSNIITSTGGFDFIAQGITVGMPISGKRIPVGARITEVTSSTAIKISLNATVADTSTAYIIFTSSTAQKLFLDSPVFGINPSVNLNSDLNGIPSKDVEISAFNGIDLVTYGNPILPTYLKNTYIADSEFTTAVTPFQINATMYEQAKLTMRLTSTTGIVNTISIKTAPVYNRKGYYSKYTSTGAIDYEFLRFDGTPNEANGFQVVPYKELAQRQAFNVTKPNPKLVTGSGGITATTLNSLDNNMASGIFNVPGDKDGQYPSNGNVLGFTTTSATTSRGLFLDKTNGKIVIRADGTLGATTNTFDLKAFDAPGYVLIQYNRSNGTTIDGNQTITGWKNIRTTIYSYQTVVQSSNGIYEFTGAKPVMSSLSDLETYTGIHASVVFDLFFIKASSAETIQLYPYGNPPNIRAAYIDIDRTGSSPYYYSAVLREYCYDTVINDFGVTSTANTSSTTGTSSNSPNEPFFTFHPHKKRIQNPIAFLSPNYNNHKFGVATAGQSFIKSQSTLWDDYVQSIIDGFNKQFRLKGIDASLRKGLNVGEFIIDYPDGQKIELRNDYGSHEFYPNINVTTTYNSGTSSYSQDFITLATRTNKEYTEKNLIKWSRRDIPEITTPALYAYLGKTDKAIIGAAANADDLYVFKEDGIWRCTDNGNTNFAGNNDLPNISTSVFSTNIICQAGGSIQEINDEIIFLSQYGFMSITGGGIQNISNSIQRDILTLLQISPKTRIRSYVNETKNLYCCTFINETDSTLDVKTGTYIFNTQTRQWSFMDEEILDGIQDSNGRTLAVYRQRPVNATLLNTVSTPDGLKPTFSFSTSYDSNNRLVRSTETSPLDMFYVTREQYTNSIRYNALDQYDYISETRSEGSSATFWIQKTGTNEFCIKTETIPVDTYFRNKFRTSAEYALMPSFSTTPAIGDTVKIVDSFVTLFANRSIYIKRINGTAELTQIRIKKTDIQQLDMIIYFEFVDLPPTWFSSMANGFFNTNGTATYQILAGVPVKITFNPESGNQPDTNKLFQEYMIHTETSNKGALMSFKTDSQASYTADRRFVYDTTAANRTVFRTYIPTKVARGRYLIRQVKHDVPLENLIITGQTIVMRDSGSTRVQKDKDDA